MSGGLLFCAGAISHLFVEFKDHLSPKEKMGEKKIVFPSFFFSSCDVFYFCLPTTLREIWFAEEQTNQWQNYGIFPCYYLNYFPPQQHTS